MMYIKLDEDMKLVVTMNEPIYRGDNLNKKIVYLIPLKVGEIDMLNATPYLSYIRADGVPDIVRLERTGGKYKEAYYQYVFPVTCRLTKFPGEVCSWLQIFSGTPSSPTIAKSGECLLYIEDSKNMDDFICDHQLSAIYALQKQTETSGETVEAMQAEIEKKGDGLSFDAEKQILQLTANGKPVGAAIDMSKMANDDDVIHFEDGTDSQSADKAGAGADAVIYFG